MPEYAVPIVSVSHVADILAEMLSELGTVAVTGELASFSQASSGHRYFTLKDDRASLNGVMWRQRRLDVVPVVGMRVVAQGQLAVYSDRSQYQLDCSRLTPAGQGELYLAFVALKAKLQAAGYFEAERKRPLPDRIWRVGVVTSATGAVIHDICTTLQRRLAAIEVVLCPASVQGEQAPAEIARSIAILNAESVCDVLIVGRGGGSLQDLWAFNSEAVVQAIYNSQIPVISAVGHESDLTLADCVADVRAATPTAAAELVSPRTLSDWQGFLAMQQQQLDRAIALNLSHKEAQLNQFQAETVERRLLQRLHQAQQRLDDLDELLQQACDRAVTQQQQQVRALQNQLAALNPKTPLLRGYALLRQGGHIVAASQAIAPSLPLDIVRSQETLTTTITQQQERDNVGEL